MPPAQSANWFNFSWVGDQIQCVACYIDVQAMAQLSQGRTKGPLVPDVIARITLTAAGFAALHHQINSLGKAMIERGIPLEEMAKVGPIDFVSVLR